LKTDQAPFRGDIFVEIQPKTFSKLRQERHIPPLPDDVAPDGACDFYKTQNYKYAAPTALCSFVALLFKKQLHRRPLRRGGEAIWREIIWGAHAPRVQSTTPRR